MFDMSHLLKFDLMQVTVMYIHLFKCFQKGARNPLKKVKWLRIVLDEGHAIKNPLAQQTKAVLELDAQRKWVLTGQAE
jgi:SWI/SNF-related matrix-associated actin-dependent regulator of chromatin subfamily A3